MRVLVRALVTAGFLFAAAFAVLQFGLARPDASDLVAAKVVGVLDRTRGGGAVIAVGSRRIVSTCTLSRKGSMSIALGDGTRIVAAGPHILARYRVGATRSLAMREPSDLASAELVLTGSHRLYARQITGRLLRRSVPVQAVDYRGTAAYEVTLRADRPHEGLIVDKETLRPVAAVYRSADLKATSRLFAVGPGRRGC